MNQYVIIVTYHAFGTADITICPFVFLNNAVCDLPYNLTVLYNLIISYDFNNIYTDQELQKQFWNVKLVWRPFSLNNLNRAKGSNVIILFPLVIFIPIFIRRKSVPPGGFIRSWGKGAIDLLAGLLLGKLIVFSQLVIFFTS